MGVWYTESSGLKLHLPRSGCAIDSTSISWVAPLFLCSFPHCRAEGREGSRDLFEFTRSSFSIYAGCMALLLFGVHQVECIALLQNSKSPQNGVCLFLFYFYRGRFGIIYFLKVMFRYVKLGLPSTTRGFFVSHS